MEKYSLRTVAQRTPNLLHPATGIRLGQIRYQHNTHQMISATWSTEHSDAPYGGDEGHVLAPVLGARSISSTVTALPASSTQRPGHRRRDLVGFLPTDNLSIAAARHVIER